MTTPTPTPAAPAQRASVLEDLVDIFYAPRSVFERRRDGRFWVALIVLAVVLGVLYWLSTIYLAPIYDATFERVAAAATKANPQVTPEMMQQGRAMQEKIGLFTFPIVQMIAAFIMGVLIWAIGKIFESTQTLAQGVVVATYAMYPQIIEWAARVGQGAAMDVSGFTNMNQVSLSLARFLNPESTSPVLVGLASRVDVFAIWTTFLIALGLHVTGNVPKARAWIVAVIMWLLASGPAIWAAARA